MGAVPPKAGQSLLARFKDDECDTSGENQPWSVVGLQRPQIKALCFHE